MRKIGKYLSVLFIMTALLLVYVHQQIINLQISYRLNKQEEQLTKVIDTHKNLKYELASLKSPTSVEQKLAEADISLVLPKQVKVVRVNVAPVKAIEVARAVSAPENTGFLQLFGFAREAQAEPSK